MTNARASTFIKEILLKLESHVGHQTLIVGDFNIPFLPTNRSSREKLNIEIEELTDFMNQMDLTANYRTFHPNTKEYTFLAAPHRIFSKSDHILSHKVKLKGCKKT